MRKISRFLLYLTLLSFLLLLATAENSQAQSEAYTLNILESNGEGVVIELTLPQYKAETVSINGLDYSKIGLDDWPLWGAPGEPGLPMFSLPLAMPTTDTPEINILSAEFNSQTNVNIAPNPQRIAQGTLTAPTVIEQFTLDTDSYHQNSFLPGALAEAAEPGFLRHQAMFQLRLYPFQYNPATKTLKQYHRLKIEVRFAADEEIIVAEPAPIFENILQNALANYNDLPHPIKPANTPILPAKNKTTTQARLVVEDEGLYRLTYANLQAVVPALVQGNPRHLQLSNRGNVIPIYIEGESDGSFDPGDSIIFFGEAIDNVYTRQNVYFLADAGQNGARMAQQDVTPGAGTTPTSFPATIHLEEENEYWQALPNGTGKDHWFWSDITVAGGTPVSVSYPFNLNNLPASGTNGEIKGMLQGFTYGNHKTQLYLNGTPLLSGAEQNWSGRSEKLYQISIPHTLFNEGSNTLKVEAILPSGSSVSEFYVNWFEVSYQDSYTAQNNSLTFSAPTTATHAFEVNNFSSNAISLIDISTPASPTQLINHQMTPNGATYTLRFNNSAGPQTNYQAYQASQLPAPGISAYQPTNWQSPDNGATYLIITHPSFGGHVQELATYRANQGEVVEVITTDEIYNEFNGGIYEPQGIKNFLEYAYANWSPQPIYVLLVGDASMDPKNNRGSSLPDLLPAIFVDTPLFGEAPNDAWYAKVHGDDAYPDLIVGRLPVRWGSGVENITAKIQSYEQSPPTGDWLRRAILVADDGDPSFTADMDAIATMLPAGVAPIKMYNYTPGTSVKNEVNSGGLILAYSGHGSTGVWGKWNNSHSIFSKGDIQTLSNGNRLPFMSVANCLNGFFASYNSANAMAEEWLVLNNKGGIASWAPASYAWPSINQLINAQLYQSLLIDGDLAFGSAATTARIEAYLQRPDFPLELYEVFTYFGDPAVRLNLPAELELGAEVTPNPVPIGALIDYTLSYTVSGTGEGRGLVLENTLPGKVTYLSANPPPSSVYGQTLTWNLGDVPAGSYSIDISGRVKTSGVAHNQTLQNQTILSDDTGYDETIYLNVNAQDTPITGLSASNSGPVEFGSPVSLSASTTGGTNIVYTWNFGDGSPLQTGAMVQHTYPAVNNYIATVTASNGVSNQAKTTTVVIGDVPPLASYTTSSPDLLGQPTNFNSASQGTNLSYRWDFGDGSPPLITSQSAVNHTYASVGDFQTTLTITNPIGSDNTARTVKIRSLPTANFSSSSPTTLGQPTNFSNSSLGGGDAPADVSYHWDFGDGANSTQTNPAHSYGAVGTFYVTLTTYNSVGNDVFIAPVQITDVPVSGLSASNNGPKQLGTAVNLSASVGAGSNVSYTWNFGDGTPVQNGANISHLYPAVGSYSATVTASNGVGSQNANTIVSITDIPPTANFYTSSPDLVGQQTSFNSASSGTNLSYTWNFGDGTPPLNTASPAIAHSYVSSGTYSVVLTASNSAGSHAKQKTVRILAPPTASFSHSGPNELGQTTIFSNTSLSGGENPANMSYLWNFGDGFYSGSQNPTHSYASVGSYQVTLTASHILASDSVTHTVIITDVPISGLSVDNDSPTLLGQQTSLQASVSAGSNISYVWNPGDGSGLKDGPIINHIYPAVGLYTAHLTATNSRNSFSLSTTISITDISPVANFISSSPDVLGQTSAFENLSDGSNLSFSWHFGDGNTSSLITPSHVYTALGSYTVWLTATNSANIDSISQTVEIIASPIAPQASFSVSTPTTLGTESRFINTSSDGGAELITYSWNFGDGNNSPNKHPVYTYGAVGTYTVWLTASTVHGTSSSSQTITVIDQPLAGLSLSHSTPTYVQSSLQFSATVAAGSNISYTWDMGDGVQLIGPAVDHTFNTLGNFTVSLTASNSINSLSLSQTLNIIDQPITGLSISASAPTYIGQSTQFTPSITSGSNIDYLWRFGDGFTSTLLTPSHLYTALGSYPVTLIASNSQGSRTANASVDVIEEAIAGLSMNHSGPTPIGSGTAFTATVTGGTNVSYEWDFGDGTLGSGEAASHIYSALGDYTVSLTASNSLGSAVISQLVAVRDVPISGLSITSNSPTLLGTPTTLNAHISGGTNVSYTWDFGNGFTATTQSAVYTYPNTGAYSVMLTATNSWHSQTLSQTVTIFEWDTPIENLGIEVSQPVYVEQGATFSPTHSAGSNISYVWDFGDGLSSTLTTPVHTYTAVGTYSVALIASNNRGSVISQTSLNVYEAPISGLTIIHDGPTLLGEATSLRAGISGGSNVSYQWNLGDGTSSTLPNFSHTYSQTGVYQLGLTATNSVDSVFTHTSLSIVTQDEPISNLVISTSSPSLFKTATQFTATFSAGSNISFQWDFGDGYTSALQNPSHTYLEVGNYTVLLTATNSWGSLLKTNSVSVLDIPVAGLNFSYSEPVVAGQALTFTAVVTAGSNVVFNWDFGDGQTASGASVSHSFANPGLYQVSLSGANSANSVEVVEPVYVAGANPNDYNLFLPLVLK